MFKLFYCVFCNENLEASAEGMYKHHDVYHEDEYIYNSETNTHHLVPLNRKHLRH